MCRVVEHSTRPKLYSKASRLRIQVLDSRKEERLAFFERFGLCPILRFPFYAL